MLLTRVRSCTVNTFLDRRGDCYRALVEAAGGMLLDVRDADGAIEVDAGRGASSWEGWLTNAYARAHRGDQRYDQVFVSRAVRVLRSSVPEERYPSEERASRGEGGSGYEYASDHLPIVVDLLLPTAPPPTARRWGAAFARGRLPPVGWRAQAAPAVTTAATAARRRRRVCCWRGCAALVCENSALTVMTGTLRIFRPLHSIPAWSPTAWISPRFYPLLPEKFAVVSFFGPTWRPGIDTTT